MSVDRMPVQKFSLEVVFFLALHLERTRCESLYVPKRKEDSACPGTFAIWGSKLVDTIDMHLELVGAATIFTNGLSSTFNSAYL